MDKKKLKTWSKRIGVKTPKTYRIRRAQITNCYQRPFGFIGYCQADDTIYYDRSPGEEDLCHELLHKRFPDLSEQAIRDITKIIFV